jgi:TPR repeat protein
MLLLGEGVAADAEAAVRWLVRAASAGHGPAAALLAELYRTGAHGVPVSEAESRRWAPAAESWRQG